jgi:protein-S-isoprenylcysteine O-methyltransferase Ste14
VIFMVRLFALFRTVIYATLFIGLVLVYLPSRVAFASGIPRPQIALPQIAGLVITTIGGAIALWCVISHALVGRGTPAPFDPPRRLITQGPYRFARNPMYVGAGTALAGATVFYLSWPLAIYACALGIAAHLFVVFYEEPTLERTFGPEYKAYKRQVGRWWPAF